MQTRFLVLAAALVASTAAAQPASAPAARPASAPAAGEPVVRDHVTQDSAVRIEERQVRGATTSIQVQPLHGGAAYQVTPPNVSTGTGPNPQGHAQWTIGTFN
jgi:hypothetical protein